MSKELRLAAERVRRVRDTTVRHSGPECRGLLLGVYDEDNIDDATDAFAHDEGRLADAYLAEHPADDDDPADAEWLRRAGFYRGQQPAGDNVFRSSQCVPGRYAETVLPVVSVELPRQRLSEIPSWVVYVYDQPMVYNAAPTRGDIRRIFAALGVPLARPEPKESSTGGVP